MGLILSGPEIVRQICAGNIKIDPFVEKNVNPASIDLCLGTGVSVYESWVDYSASEYQDRRTLFTGECLRPLNHELNVREVPRVRSFDMCSRQGWVLLPGILYLMHTMESVWSDRFVPVLDGKSSIGRLGIQVHITAGYFDPGFRGQGTLEVTALHPVRVYPGMRFCQMRFHHMVGSFMDYQKVGHYTGDGAVGAVPSAAYKQFHDES